MAMLYKPRSVGTSEQPAARILKVDELQQQAIRTLANHTYTQVAKMDGLEVWQCRQPGHGFHSALDILITRATICVVGDYNPVIFRVGESYGLGFLSREVDSYYCEKLDNIHEKEREYSEERALAAVQNLCELWLDGNGHETPRGADFLDKVAALRDEMIDVAAAGGSISGQGFDVADALVELGEGISGHETVRDFYDAMQRGGKLGSLVDDFYPTVDAYSDNLKYRLYLTQAAARAILAQEEKGKVVDVAA